MKRAHPEDYNSQDLRLVEKRAPTTRAKWTASEMRQLALLESQLPPGLQQKEIVSELSTLHTGRTHDAIKKLRQRATYREILSEMILPIGTDPGATPVPPTGSQGSERGSAIEADVPSTATIAPSNVIQETPDEEGCSDVLLRHAGVCVFLKELSPSCSPEIQTLITKFTHGTSFEEFDPFISSAIRNLSLVDSPSGHGTSARARKGGRGKSGPNKHKKLKKRSRPNHNTRRAQNFSKFQRLFAKNPTQLAHAILDDKDTDVPICPAMTDIEEYFRPQFEECPEYQGQTPQPPREVIQLDYPIAISEVELSLRRLKQSACGPDGITRDHLREANLADVVGLLNIVFGLCRTPTVLRHNRTVLIPKKGDLSTPSNWRPITISSCFTRLLHKILASRLSMNINLHHAQRGFTPTDGLMTSCTVLDTVIREHRMEGRPLYVMSIDLTKAFDRIHPHAIELALYRKGVDRHTIKYIMSTYEDVDTFIECHGQKSAPIRMCRGVRQGDTDSPILFNIVVDQLVTSIDTNDGVKLGEARIGSLLFADDIIFVSNTVHGMREHLRKLDAFLKRTFLEVNPSKCRTLQLARVPGTKRIAADTKSRFSIDGRQVPTLNAVEQLKYLGHNYDRSGMLAPSASNLKQMLERLRRAALRPWQKLFMLNRHLIPRLIHCSQTSNITAGKLDYFDRLIRIFVKATPHLPVTTPTAFLHAKIRDGGLSVPCLRHQIGVIYRRRLQRVSLQSDPDFYAAFQTPSFKRLMRRLDIICQGIPTSRNAVARHWAMKFHQSALGSGLEYHTRASTSWINNPPPFWSGRDYIRAIQLRIGLLPTGGAPYVSANAAQCRHPTCAGRRETLSHVLQWCPVTHYPRILRHDKATQDLAEHLKSTGLEIQEAPRIHTRDNRYIPDLLVIDRRNNTGNIIETSIIWEHGTSLLDAAKMKKCKYDVPELLSNVQANYNLQKPPEVFPFIVGARGGWPPVNHIIWQHYKLPDKLQRIVVCNVLRYGSSIHRYFMAHTWRSRKK